ncbi:hypothetical protein [Ruminiclostridium josui]|uniref:hypothetical protein n=1 Tax=Ruminiclostridium josui TaxID=1499 RepID=UPI000463C3D8|nr:hypothetical protein [Ruminiclostridium josui]
MGDFIELNYEEIQAIEAGGLLSAVCGAAAGAIVGLYVGGTAVAISGDSKKYCPVCNRGCINRIMGGVGLPYSVIK